MNDNVYIPGVCNIGPAEIAMRKRVGWGALAVTVALEEYQLAKSEMVSAKQLLKDKITAFERKGVSWFELPYNL